MKTRLALLYKYSLLINHHTVWFRTCIVRNENFHTR